MKKAKRILMCVAAGIAFVLVLGLVTMLLWNWLVPAVFNGPEIRFFEAIGIWLLAKILFGRWGGGRWSNGRYAWKHRFQEKLSAMTPEERERFKSRMREKWRCGDAPEPNAKTSDTID